MGDKRVIVAMEVTYPGDDPRELGELTGVTARGMADGVAAQGATGVRVGVTGASVDPDPEPVAEDVV